MSEVDRVIERLAAAREAVAALVRRTPTVPDEELSAALGGRIVFKAENLQRTGSFKVRGAAAKLSALDPSERARGVVAASAGNHAQGVALAARELGVRCQIFMPASASVTKVDAVERLGASVRFLGGSVDDAIEGAIALAREPGGPILVHPFDDPDVIAGQATIAAELLEQEPDLAKVLVPVGGGGLASGIAVGLRAAGSSAHVVGVQAEACASMAASVHSGHAVSVRLRPTIADGIAVVHAVELTRAILVEAAEEIVTVNEEEIGAAMAYLAERSGLVVEGAGAVGLAALMSGADTPAPQGTTVVVLSGANVDASVLAQVARRRETLAGRRLALLARVSDRPGGLAGLLALIAEAGANVVDIDHLREGVELDIGETVVQVVLETRGPEHARAIVAAIEAGGYRPATLR